MSVFVFVATAALCLVMPRAIADVGITRSEGWGREWVLLSAVVCAASVHLPMAAISRIAPLLAFGTGLCCGVAAMRDEPMQLWCSLPWLLAIYPATWTVERGAGIAVKVVSSWLLAAALLAAALSWLPVTPGYLPDHLE